jgi:hypothetical protein
MRYWLRFIVAWLHVLVTLNFFTILLLIKRWR